MINNNLGESWAPWNALVVKWWLVVTDIFWRWWWVHCFAVVGRSAIENLRQINIGSNYKLISNENHESNGINLIPFLILSCRYCAGTMPWGNPGDHHDFEPQRHDDGYIEVIGFTMASLVSNTTILLKWNVF